MSFAPLLGAPVGTALHAFAALAAFVLGIVQFALPKGTGWHRTLGWVWVALMAGVALSSFSISFLRQLGPFSFIHLISIYVLIVLPIGVLAARRHEIGKHRRVMISLYAGALVVAGAFTFLPGRLMHEVAFGALR
jgi:uncharacterized membrane protein